MILRHPTRLAIARLCASRPQTISGLCKRLGTKDGAVRHTVKQMEIWTVLKLDPGSSPQRAIYALNSGWREDLEQVRSARPFELAVGQRLLLGSALEGSPEADDGIAWVAEFGRQKKSLLALLDTPTSSSGPPKRDEAKSGELLQVSALRVVQASDLQQ